MVGELVLSGSEKRGKTLTGSPKTRNEGNRSEEVKKLLRKKTLPKIWGSVSTSEMNLRKDTT